MPSLRPPATAAATRSSTSFSSGTLRDPELISVVHERATASSQSFVCAMSCASARDLAQFRTDGPGCKSVSKAQIPQPGLATVAHALTLTADGHPDVNVRKARPLRVVQAIDPQVTEDGGRHLKSALKD